MDAEYPYTNNCTKVSPRNSSALAAMRRCEMARSSSLCPANTDQSRPDITSANEPRIHQLWKANAMAAPNIV